MTADQLKNIFESPYNQKIWTTVLSEVFGIRNIFLRPQEVDTTGNNWDALAWELGNFETQDRRLIGVYEVQINVNVKLQRNKVGLRNLLKPIYDNDVDAALVVFNQGHKWRFSYVSEISIRNKETGKREKRRSDPKRYTYLLGQGQKCRTAAERFAKINQHFNLFGGGVKLEEIEKAFSVDSLTKDFYRELSDWYFRALKEVRFPDDADRAINSKPTPEEKDKQDKTRNATHTIRLITRLIFVWFLKQKGLVPEELFLKEEIDNLINYRDKTGSTYYKAILQNLFFATLNTEMGDENRKFIERQYGVQTFYRYKRFFKNTDRFLELTKNIPFLNGGLFENLDKNIEDAEEDNKIRIDCFSNALKNEDRLIFPDSLFFNKAIVDLSDDYGDKKRKDQKVNGLIGILQSYNFTVEENTPFEVEVALDPELLGKVFENLLASYNPETETTARKMTGSFYTPREIVDYMVDESLKTYLNNFLSNDAEHKLNQLFSYTTNPPLLNDFEKQKLIHALDEAKILDPACGSGAFPMGVLHKMVLLLTKLDPKNENWKEIQRQKAIRETDDAFKLGNKSERDERLKDISEAFEDNSDDYGRKLYLIENCIYGVDIQSIAVQIAKLRFFISLICDQEVNEKRKNRGVRPLPNLETKFVSANTLGRFKKQLLLRNPKIEELEIELNKIRHNHFGAKTTATKRKWRHLDHELRKQIGDLLRYDGWDNTIAEKISNWNPYEQNSTADFFDSEWMFGIVDGFDIVIGNPPYMSLQRMDNTEELKKSNYKTFEKTGDLYSLFYEQGNSLLKQNGVLCYITSNKWINANYGRSTRKFFSTQTNPLILIDFAKLKIFEAATVFVNILIFEKASNQNRLYACTVEGEKLPEEELKEYFNSHKFLLKDLDENIWKVNNANASVINNLIEIKGIKLKDWTDINFYRGITSGLNEAFHIHRETRDELINKSPKNETIIKRLLRGKDIKRWAYQFDGWYLINSHNGLKGSVNLAPINVVKDFPDIYNHLLNFKAELIARQDQGYHWTNLRDCAFLLEFDKPKIVWIEISDRANYAYDESGMFLTNSAYFMTGKHLKYILAVLNSKVADYYFSQITATIAGGRKRYTKQYVELVPVPQISEDEQKPFIKIVDYILFLKSHIEDKEARNASTHFESVLETMVYELYFDELVKKNGFEIVKYISELPDLDKSGAISNYAKILDAYKLTYGTESPIRNSLFFIDSIPEIKEIISSLS